jgi:hypothetical protein
MRCPDSCGSHSTIDVEQEAQACLREDLLGRLKEDASLVPFSHILHIWELFTLIMDQVIHILHACHSIHALYARQ